MTSSTVDIDLSPSSATTFNPHDRSAAGRSERARLTEDLLARAAAEGDGARRLRLLDDVVVVNMGVANAVVSRYTSRGIATEDLQQVAYLALVKAARGFQVEAGSNFLSYCVPTIRGEVKRHFRDHGWSVRPPRRVQELQSALAGAESELSFTLGRPPRPGELADHLGESLGGVIEALTADGCFTPSSLDRPAGPETDTSVGDLLGGEDTGQPAAEARVALAPVVRRLRPRDRHILMLRFFRGFTQQEIADDIGVTQMQVSRLLNRIFADLRNSLTGEDGAEKLPG